MIANLLRSSGWTAKGSIVKQAIGNTHGCVVCYGEDGCMIPDVTEPPAAGAGDGSTVKLKAGIAEKIVLASCGVDGSVSVFLPKSSKYTSLMEQILQREANGHETMVRRIIADSGLAVSYRIPPLPAPLWRVVFAKAAAVVGLLLGGLAQLAGRHWPKLASQQVLT
ncbi:MAG: hypothetical protein LBB26_01000 [Puniceicoccales bacterium]|nr:hypothetical protein [Puniceicoccales bacterium]